MPNAPPRACYCGRIGCTVHARPKGWGARAITPPRVRGRALQRLRARLFEESPLCVLCLAEHRTTVATIRDHVIPLTEGGIDDDSNTQALCSACHDAKTEQEAKRGIARFHGRAR